MLENKITKWNVNLKILYPCPPLNCWNSPNEFFMILPYYFIHKNLLMQLNMKNHIQFLFALDLICRYCSVQETSTNHFELQTVRQIIEDTHGYKDVPLI